MKLLVFAFLFLSTFLSCSNPISKILGKKTTPHEGYAGTMKGTAGGNYWVTVSENTLLIPHPVKLPHRQLGYFPKGKARALSLQFSVRRGEKLSIELNSTDSLQLFADVFKQEGAGINHLMAFEKNVSDVSFDAEETGIYILRLQPPLESSGQYDLVIKLSPSLGFPVAGKKARVGSVWGDPRDNGVRSHEGIDIFAPKLTPAIAAADGTISSVKDGGLGGKTVNLKVKDRNLNLYYAHLDQQLVNLGQSVKKGDTIGLVGNTGNAQTTPPHLHFGIYTYGGPIDPLPFVDKATDLIPVVTNKDLLHPLQLTKELLLKDKSTIKAKTKLLPLAVTAAGYIAELESGKLVEVEFRQVKKA